MDRHPHDPRSRREPTTCDVHWSPAVLRPGDDDILDAAERTRAARLRRTADRARFVAAAVLLRCVLADLLDCRRADVPLDRRCDTCGQQHGRPRVPGTDVHLSVSHSGTVVGVAVAPRPVGLDVEILDGRDLLGLAADVLGPDEQVRSPGEFLRYWTRKESACKATGDGIGVGLPAVRVSRPDEPARLLAYPGTIDLAASMRDLRVVEGYSAAVTVLGAQDIAVVECRHPRPVDPCGESDYFARQ